MPDKLLIPSIEMRLGSLMECNRRNQQEAEKRIIAGKIRPTITISREYGCEAFPVAERLKELMEKKTGETWVVMDKALLEEVAKNHNLSGEILKNLGEKARFLDEIISTFSNRWKSEKDHYRLLCKQIISLAENGNVIIVGRGSAIVTQAMKNCYHFRMYASEDFKVRSIARRLHISVDDAEKMVAKKQQIRDKFIHDFLDRDARDLSFYHLVFNNDKCSSDKIARMMMDFVLSD